MIKYPCLVLDHDDTVVQSEKTIGYPFFCHILDQFRPGERISLKEYVWNCHELGFAEMCRKRWHFTQMELDEEYHGWMEYVKTHIPDPFPGIDKIIRKQKEAGGMICVVSHSSIQNITRDYETHFGILPDAIYGWDLPEEKRKPNPFPLLNIMEKYHFSSEEILVVDDMKLAWRMANPLRIKLAFAAWGKLDFPELSAEMRSLSDFSFDTTDALARFLFSED